jgi:hypothetical protein
MMASCKSHTNETLFPAVLLRISYFHVDGTKRRTQIFAGRRITDGIAAGSGISLGCPASLTSMVSIARTQAYLPGHAPMVFAVAHLHAALAGPIAEFANQPIGYPDSGCDEVTR